jgi:hypothetical protein
MTGLHDSVDPFKDRHGVPAFALGLGLGNNNRVSTWDQVECWPGNRGDHRTLAFTSH